MSAAVADDTPIDDDLLEVGDILADYRNTLSAVQHDLVMARATCTQLRRVIAAQRAELQAKEQPCSTSDQPSS